MKIASYILTAMAAFMFMSAACTDETPNFVVPAPDTGNGQTNNGGGSGNNGNGDNSGQPEVPAASLCDPEFLGQSPMIIAYYTENSSVLPDPACLTHINYAHGRFVNKETGDGGIWIEQPEKLQKVVELKKQKPSLKVLLMIGGWGDKADGFSEMARDAKKRALFCQTCAEHIKNYNLDGIDIDWEYPTAGPSENGKHPDDTRNFNIVLKELREAIGNEKIISYASSANADYVDWATAMLYLDYVNVMTYDMGNPPYHNAPLYYSASITKKRSVDQSVSLHKSKGIPADRLVMGVPFYGHGTDPYKADVKYNEMSTVFSSKYEGKNIRKWDAVAKVPYLVDEAGTFLLGYDDEESVTLKGEYVMQKKLLGAMFWEYRHDDSQGTLRKALCRAMYGKESTME
jgi:chitinase